MYKHTTHCATHLTLGIFGNILILQLQQGEVYISPLVNIGIKWTVFSAAISIELQLYASASVVKEEDGLEWLTDMDQPGFNVDYITLKQIED